MPSIPPTSVTLLKAISDGTASARWTDFYRRYEPAMRGFLHERFPSVEADDVIQEAMLALTKALPDVAAAFTRTSTVRRFAVA